MKEVILESILAQVKEVKFLLLQVTAQDLQAGELHQSDLQLM